MKHVLIIIGFIFVCNGTIKTQTLNLEAKGINVKTKGNWSGWYDANCTAALDFTNRVFEIYSKDRQSFHIDDYNMKTADYGTIYYMTCTDERDVNCRINMFFYSTGNLEIEITYPDIEYKYQFIKRGEGAPLNNSIFNTSTPLKDNDILKSVNYQKQGIINEDCTTNDIDGNVYHVVSIGSQVWMVENLKTSTYNDGCIIPYATGDVAWANSTRMGAFCWYENDKQKYGDFGNLYNWNTVKTGKLCPKGWHVPSNEEWKELVNYLQLEYKGKPIASKTFWNITNKIDGIGNNLEYNNSSGFNALPTGLRNENGSFFGFGNEAQWWSSDKVDHEGFYWSLDNDGFIRFYHHSNMYGVTIRCIKDKDSKECNCVVKPIPNKDVIIKMNQQGLTDIEGNIYKTVIIGKQEWMSENLKVTKYNDGLTIPCVDNPKIWTTLNTGAYCWYKNDKAIGNVYGALYNYYIISSGKLCPKGWHIPTVEEWKQLEDYVNAYLGTYNSTGFSALPGYRYCNGTFSDLGLFGSWWSATEYNTSSVWYMSKSSLGSHMISHLDGKGNGFSVRCVKDSQ